MFSLTGQSLHFPSNIVELRAEIGQPAVQIQCILDGSLQNNVEFMWTGPALDSCTAGHTAISRDISGGVSTLTINDVSTADTGEYSCSYAGTNISITLIVECM